MLTIWLPPKANWRIAVAVEKYEKSDENKKFRRQEKGKLERKHQNINGVRYGDHRPEVNRNPLLFVKTR